MTDDKTSREKKTTTQTAPAAGFPTVRYEFITPAFAAEMLAHNTNNRRVRRARVLAYASQMKSGAWHLTHQGVAIGHDGLLYDGQHRLMAVVESGASVWMLVVRGLAPSARAEIDTGDKRVVCDTIRIVDGITHSSQMTGACRVIALVSGDATHRTRAVPIDEHRRIMDEYADGIAAIEAVFHSAVKNITRSPVLAALVFAYNADPDGVVSAAVDLRDGANLAAGDPILALRNSLSAAASRRDEAEGVFFKFKRALAAIDARLRGRKLMRSGTKDGALIGNAVFERYAAVNAAKAA